MSSADDETIGRVRANARGALQSVSWCHLSTRIVHADERVIFEGLGPVTRRVRGTHMRTWARLFDEFGTAWRLPPYEGSNSGAFFHDSLGDLHRTWPTTVGFVVIVTEPEQVLQDEPMVPSDYTGNDLEDLVTEFADAAEWLAEPISGPANDITARPALSFDVVLVTDAEHVDEVRDLWTRAGAPLSDA